MPPPPLHVSFLLSCLLTLVSSTSSASAICTSTSSASAISTEDANSTTTQLHAGATGDRQALLCFKSQLSDPAGVLASWSNTSLDVCSWHGVTCNMSQASHVTELNLENSQLSGTIPPCIANLTFLEAIRFPNNNLRGHIPSELGQLRRLWHLNLSTNSLNGNIPTSFGRIPSLVYLDLAGNGLTGQLPESLATSSSLQVLKLRQNNLGGDIPGFLFNTSSLVRIDLRQNNFSGIIPPVTKIVSSLKYLSLSGNKLSGSIPASLRNLSSLSYLYLDQNNLVGSIPESLAGIQSLRRLALTANKLSGLVPPSLYNVSTLVDLDLSHNLLLGRMPDDIGTSLSSIEWLILEDNKFEGPVPASLANASSLQVLDLANNSFSGAIPLLGSLQNLSYLDFSINQLEAQDWAFLSSLSNCTQLTKLCLMSNNFEGSLPSSIGKLPTKLDTLWLNLNKISGAIPLEIGNITSLTVLLMQDNLLSGSIPSVIGALRNLSVLSLSRNNLSGPIPDSFSNLEQLFELYLVGNKLSGNIPTSLGSCKNLQILNLSHNSLDGSIPIELLKISSLSEVLGLSHNSLTGPIPQEVGRLINLGRLTVSYNQLSGQIPSSLGQCVMLEFLHMEGNILHGSIPQSFMSLKGIKEMDLSQNNLSGEIPEFLASFTSLYSLNLSFNDFSGAVPTKGVFANTTEVSIQGNKRLCARVPMLELPLCSEDSKTKHKPRTLKIVIPLAVVAAVSLLSCLVAVLLKRRAAQPSVHDNEKVKVSYEDIVKATNRFSPANLLGSGSFGTVYTGRFQFDVNPVAIKVFNLKLYGASRSFVAECEALRSIRHRNLVKVITSCSTVDHIGIEFKALIFQYMPNGNLDVWLHPKIQVHDQTKVLSLGQRISIALDVAFALDYIHNQAVCPLVHCDLKPQNILLDFDKNAYVGDFGLSRFLCSNSTLETTSSTNLTGLKGSIGYIAPEYGMGAQISTEGDVYSYGVLLLELLTGKRPTDETFKNDLSLHTFVHSAFPDRIGDILDPFLLQESTEYGNLIAATLDSFIIPLIKLGLLCSLDSPKDRPRMEHVATEIRKIKSSFRA